MISARELQSCTGDKRLDLPIAAAMILSNLLK